MEITVTCFVSEKGIPIPFPCSLLETIQACTANIVQEPNGQQVSGSRYLMSSPPTEILLGLASAGVFTAVFQCIAEYLKKNPDREVHFRSSNVEITVKGYNLEQAKDIFDKLFAAHQGMDKSLQAPSEPTK